MSDQDGRSCTCGINDRMTEWRKRGPFSDMPLHDTACPAVNHPPREGCAHLWRGDMGDITAPMGYVKCAHCHGLKPEADE